jgi:hypothetical protein
MIPLLARNDSPNGASVDPEALRHRATGLTRRDSGPDVSDGRRRQFGRPVDLTETAHPLGILSGAASVAKRLVTAAPSASLFGHIPHVVGMRAEEKVGRIAARRVVAVMQDHLALRNRSKMRLPRDPMQRLGAPLARHADNAIAIGIPKARSVPTGVWAAGAIGMALNHSQ